MTINQKIQNIVELRAKHLPKIEEELDRLSKIEEELKQLESLRSDVQREMNEGKGTYFSMLNENPKMHQAFSKVNTDEVRRTLSQQKKNLENLKKRFSRETVCIAMIGYERQGKSRFLQAISGLGNKVIPAYSGTSCTGAVSVIHNIEGPFRTEITYYSLEEFLEIVRQKVKSFFPDREFSINSPQDLKHIDLSGFKTTNKDLNGEYNKFKSSFCGHVDEYCHLLGRGTVSYSDENDVIQHVAQYEEFDHPVEGAIKVENEEGKAVYTKFYNKYLAVKSVHIYKTFEMIDSKLIELVDTIGIGDNSRAQKIKDEMFRVLREDCDVAVDLFKPDALGGGFNDPQAVVLQEIADRLKDRKPSKWITYVINKVSSGKGENLRNIGQAMKGAEQFVDTMEVRPVAWIKAVDGSDPEEIRRELVNPLLELITTNLPELDSLLMEEVNKNGETLRDAYYRLVNNVEAVISGSLMRSASEGKLFSDLYEQLSLPKALRVLDEEKYLPRRNRPCPEIEKALSDTIENIYDSVPKKADVIDAIDRGVMGLAGIYESCCDEMRTLIVRQFNGVSDFVISPLRESTKEDIARVLFEDGHLGNIPLKSYSVSEGPSLKWLRALVDERIKENDYPQLRKILLYVLDYDFTIKYTIEYDVTSSLGMIDKMNLVEYRPLKSIDFGTVEERAKALRQQLLNKIPHLQEKLKQTKNQFSLIPSHSFWTMINNFRTDLVRGKDTSRDLREFYRDHAWSIWRNEFSSIVDKQEAFGRWNEVSQKLSDLYSPAGFTLTN